ncbi:ABC transporter substrate-binding protein [Mycolicibacterium sp. F2034L]|uniref:ABC transporter substrate-binding protein n=1 Tax=Mycolicibacterium sp. F2034L TaxID=2926422 RepID=UPI001FF5FCC8|nr:ABC transporter substrate-binding protein [Mycolicibacterium sp. F2034L]MCK0174110.1 ABC transporter substrate-binding protein [Mycolicibacterium sp. F2034L]
MLANPSRIRRVMLVGAAATLLATACAPPAPTDTDEAPPPLAQKTTQPDEDPAGFDLDALIAAARTEPPITIYDQTTKVVATAEAFAAKYGLEATGVKVELGAIDKVLKENQSGNVIGDVVINEDLPTYAVELLDQGILVNWVPGDMKESIKPGDQYPLIVHYGPMGWVYNSEVHSSCPVSNIWQLTDEQFNGRVAIADPLSNAKYSYWFNTMALNDDAALRSAYKELYGTELTTDQPDAAHEWVKRFAQNSPKLTRNDEEVSEAVGAPGQQDPSFGPISMAKFRNNAQKGYHLALCDGMKPWALQSFPSAIAYAAKTDSPNAAKLYIHYMLTEEGFAIQLADGKPSANSQVPAPDDPSNVKNFMDQMSPFPSADLVSDYRTKSTWEDFWRNSYS